MNWNANGSSHSYTFTYDGVNRMLNATHGTGAYTEKVTAYDKNGNIVKLQRYGNGLIDDLSYTYSGNQLTRVDDATGNTAGFSNGASTANEYTYDNNGNLTKDSNKNISSIAYNVLNLPSTVTFSDVSTIVYSYSADGTKLRTVHTISGTTTTKDYCANVVYENGVQKMLLTEEGYVNLSASTSTYYYYLKDHQGNIRVVINGSGTVVETNHYYPFGGVFASTGNVQPYKYNGKELDTKKGLNWYDYGARHYDAALGRWLVVDPLAEKYYAWSPYNYCFNNPSNNIDFMGCDTIPVNEIWDYDLINSRTNGMGIIDDNFIPVSIDGQVKYHLHLITTGENKGNYVAIEQLGVNEDGVNMYEYKYVLGKETVNSFISGNDSPTGVQYNLIRFAKDNGVDFTKKGWENMFAGYMRIVTNPVNWLPNPFDPTNLIPKSYYTINSWNRFLMLNRGKYTKKNYGTYEEALKQRSIDYNKWKR